MVELEVLVFERGGGQAIGIDFREASRDVAFILNVVGPDLGDVQIDHELVVAIKLVQLVLVVAIDIDGVRDVDVLVGQDVRWVAVLVAWSLEVVDLQIFHALLLIDTKEEVLLGDHFFVLARCKFLGGKLVFELEL